MEGSAVPNSTTRHVESADGTAIGFDVVGDGPPLLFVHGLAADRSQWAPLAEGLGRSFTVHLPDRRGRSLSAEEKGPYSLEREAEDISALVEDIGEPTFVVGHSYGGLCVLKAAVSGVDFAALLIDESPAGRPGPEMIPAELAAGLQSALETGGREGALEFFLRNVVGLDDAAIDGVRGSDMWKLRSNIVHTMPREAAAADTYERESELWAGIEAPVRFMVGTESTEPMREAMAAAHAAIPGSELVVREGRMFNTMYSDPEAVVRELEEFFLQR